MKKELYRSIGPCLLGAGITLVQSSEFTILWALGYILLMLGLQLSVNNMMVTAGQIMVDLLDKALNAEKK